MVDGDGGGGVRNQVIFDFRVTTWTFGYSPLFLVSSESCVFFFFPFRS